MIYITKEKACKTCHIITKNDLICPKCKTHTLSEDYSGEVVILKPKESRIAEYLKVGMPGKYALRVR
ncbi:MAG: transcription elongation factor subunit Spt4 [Candidatus Hermodarchaeota archaeon]